MVLTNVVQDETMAVPGFKQHTFMCSECQDIERRFVFMKQDRNSDTEGMPEQVAPPVMPASTVQDEPVAASDLVTGPMEPVENVHSNRPKQRLRNRRKQRRSMNLGAGRTVPDRCARRYS
jgi:hypothetical protein